MSMIPPHRTRRIENISTVDGSQGEKSIQLNGTCLEEKKMQLEEEMRMEDTEGCRSWMVEDHCWWMEDLVDVMMMDDVMVAMVACQGKGTIFCLFFLFVFWIFLLFFVVVVLGTTMSLKWTMMEDEGLGDW